MLPQKISFQPSVGRSTPSDLLRAMPGHWQLRELAGAYVNGNGRCLNVSSEPARCNRPASNASSSRTEYPERRMTSVAAPALSSRATRQLPVFTLGLVDLGRLVLHEERDH